MVQFNADVADGMPWRFIPTQREVFSILLLNIATVLVEKTFVGVLLDLDV